MAARAQVHGLSSAHMTTADDPRDVVRRIILSGGFGHADGSGSGSTPVTQQQSQQPPGGTRGAHAAASEAVAMVSSATGAPLQPPWCDNGGCSAHMAPQGNQDAGKAARYDWLGLGARPSLDGPASLYPLGSVALLSSRPIVLCLSLPAGFHLLCPFPNTELDVADELYWHPGMHGPPGVWRSGCSTCQVPTWRPWPWRCCPACRRPAWRSLLWPWPNWATLTRGARRSWRSTWSCTWTR